ncbi:MAG: glycosyltransferase family 4 protein [Planctomycetes bacterium]|nr:glycosyltransferase family 4 protein [Planctomycetota bacterium]
MIPPRRLAYLCSDPGIQADGHKGASVHFRELARALRDRGAELTPVMARGGRDAQRRLPGVRIAGTSSGEGVERELRALASSSAQLDALLAAGPHDAVYERLSLFGVAGLAYAAPRKLPFAVEVNAPLWEEAERYRGLGLPRAARALAREVLDAATVVFCVSHALARALAQDGVDDGKLAVLGNGVRLAAFDTAPVARRPAALRDKPVLLFVGSLKPWHGLRFLCEAFAAARRSRPLGLWIVGDGPEREVVAALAARFPDDVVVQGAVAHEDVPAIHRAADVVVAPYGDDAPGYFSPLKVVEAIASRRRLLASRVPAVCEAIGDAPGVVLHAPDDAGGFARALDEQLAALAATGPELEDSAFRRSLGWSERAAVVLERLGPPVRALRGTSAG